MLEGEMTLKDKATGEVKHVKAVRVSSISHLGYLC